MFLRQSTAVTIQTDPIYDTATGLAAQTALAIAHAEVRVSKAGAGYAQVSVDPGAAHDAGGCYRLALSVADTGTVGPLDLMIVKTGVLSRAKRFFVLDADFYDAMVGARRLGVDAQKISDPLFTSSRRKDNYRFQTGLPI